MISHENDTYTDTDCTAKYAGYIAIVSIAALIGIRMLMERK